jgi:tetratricopeptide (TPR) repeat protein
MRKYLNGRYQAAIVDFNAAITSKPNYALAYYNQGRAYLALKQNREALQDFTQALMLNPSFKQAERAKAYPGFSS